jgi:hypothetical protein
MCDGLLLPDDRHLSADELVITSAQYLVDTGELSPTVYAILQKANDGDPVGGSGSDLAAAAWFARRLLERATFPLEESKVLERIREALRPKLLPGDPV